MHYDSHGNPKGTLRLTIREDQGHGVSLGGGVDVMPGETADFPHGLGVLLLTSGKAVHATDSSVADPSTSSTSSASSAQTDADGPTVDTPEGDTKTSTPETTEPATPEPVANPDTPDPDAPKVAKPAPLKRR